RPRFPRSAWTRCWHSRPPASLGSSDSSGAPSRHAARSASSSDRTLVLATGNRAKSRELRALLAGIPYRVLDLSAFPSLTLPAEGEVSYEDNAFLKARGVAGVTRILALADDSGIEVDALGGRPGVLSARYGGEGLSDEDRWRQMLRELRGLPPAQRTARYRCV